MQVLVSLGRGLMGLAILSLVGELAARAFLGAGGYLSAEELWGTLAPDSYVAMRAWFRQGILPVWIYGLGPILKLPAWFLLGAPGIAALWLGEREGTATEAAEAAEAAFLYDELEKRAKEEGFAADAERLSTAVADDILASAREAEADLAREPIPFSPPKAEPRANEAGANSDVDADTETPSRPPS